ncbi:MAG: VWA domain-containing protein [Geitlerinemataceae cyanobacterium]
MQADYTHLTVILDRTGSMQSIRDDTIGGFNAFLSEQQGQPGRATLTLVQFDSQDPYEVIHHFKAIEEVPDLTRETFVPRASTPLLDAIGRGINDLEQTLSRQVEANRPARIVVAIVTDGQENASKEFDRQTIEKMMADKQAADWQFVFLSADLAAIGDAIAGGVKPAAAMAFDKTKEGASAAWGSVSKRIADYRSNRAPNVAFSEVDRSQQKSEKRRKS